MLQMWQDGTLCRGMLVWKRKKNPKYGEEEAKIAQENSGSDSDPVVLMATTDVEMSNSQVWYLDTCCNNHMTGRRDWLINFYASKKTSIKMANKKSITAKWIGHVVIQRNDGKIYVIKNVFLVPDMQCNLLSVGKLVRKGFSTLIKADYLKLFDHKRSMILKSCLSRNRTFKVCIQNSELRCLPATSHELEAEQ